MQYEKYDVEGMAIHTEQGTPHYYGGIVRMLFITAALVLLVASSVGATLPLSGGAAIIHAMVLVVLAGVTNPSQRGIHWVNSAAAFFGAGIFGMSAIAHYRTTRALSDPSFFFVEALAILFLISLYYATKTIRGIYLRSVFPADPTA